MIKRRLSPKTKSKHKPGPFGKPLLLEGEDAAGYAELVAGVRAAVKPTDIIYEIFIDDFVSLAWEVLRGRRLKFGVIRRCALTALEDFLSENLEYDLYRDDFADDVTEVLQDNLPEDEEKDRAQKLAHKYAENEPEAVEKVNSVLDAINRDVDEIDNDARTRKAKEFVQEYAQGNPAAVRLIGGLLARAGKSMESLAADALADDFDYIERLDDRIAIAESRRNAALREIDRRHAMLGETLRARVQEVEDRDVKLIEAVPAKRKNAA